MYMPFKVRNLKPDLKPARKKITGTAPDTEILRERGDSIVMTALTAEPDMEEITDRIQDVPEAEPAGFC